MKENIFQSNLRKKLEHMFPGAIILKNDSSDIQGIPDLTIFYNNRWAMLECKKTSSSKRRPNQKYYTDRANEMSFARFICPENEQEVLNELQYALCSSRTTRVSRGQ